MNTFKTEILAISTLCALLLSTQLQAVTLGFFPSTTNVDAGNPFSVELRISDIDNNSAIGAYDFDINFNSSVLSIGENDVVFGNQLRQPGVDSLRSVNIGNGQLNISEISLINENDLIALQSQSDEFTVATLNFSANEPGSSQLGLSVNELGNQTGAPVPATIIPFGLSVLQRNTRSVLETYCRGLSGNQSALQELQGACSLTSNTELSNDELGSAYQNIAGEETTSPTNIALKSVIRKTQMLRSKMSARRNSIVSEKNGSNVNALQGSGYLSLAALGLEGASGGNAGNDMASLERLGLFIDATANFGETDQTDREDATHFNKEEISIGADYRFTDQFVTGLAVTYSNANANFQKSINVSGGKMAEQGYSGSIYSTYFLDNVYIDGIFSYTKRDYDIDRNIVIPSLDIRRKASADTDSDQYAANLGIGYNFRTKGFELNPYAQVSYTRLEIEGYSESGAGGLNMSVDNQDSESLESVLGASATYAWSQPFGILKPLLRAEWHHEFKENSHTIETRFVNDISRDTNILKIRTDKPDRDFATVGIGLTGVFDSGLQVFATYETLLAQQNTSSHKFRAGLRLAF